MISGHPNRFRHEKREHSTLPGVLCQAHDSKTCLFDGTEIVSLWCCCSFSPLCRDAGTGTWGGLVPCSTKFWIISYRRSPDSTVFVPLGNHTIWKTVLFGEWFITATLFMTFRISKSPLLLIFTRIFKMFWFLKLKKWLSCLFWHAYLEIYHKVWLLDKKFNMDEYFVQFIADKLLGYLR